MSKNQKGNQKDFKYSQNIGNPKLQSFKTEWDLKKLYYKSENDPQIEMDVVTTEKQYGLFVKKYSNLKFLKSTKTLLNALQTFKQLSNTNGHKPAYYLSYRLSLNSADIQAQKRLSLLEERLTKISNSILFFELALSKVPKKQQLVLLAEKSLFEFQFFLSNIFKFAEYTLTEPEERILSLKSQTSRSMWVNGTEKILGSATIKYKGKNVPLNAALMQFMDLPKKERHQMWDACIETLTSLGPIAENELNALVIDKKINDELRRYKKPYTATALGYDQNEKDIETLVKVVSSRGYELSKKFYAYKAKLLKVKFSYIDRDDAPFTLPNASFETAVSICRDAFYEFNKLYGSIFDEMLKNGQIDVYPKQGKGGGAYCSSGVHVPTLVLLNHSDDFSSIKTLAHEMGHAIHAHRSKEQSVLYEDHSIITAETASTFFEAVVAEHVLKLLTKNDAIALLNNTICDRISAIMMCVARFSAELEIHETIRKEGAMTWQEMSACLTRHFKAYCGNSVVFAETDGHKVVSQMHFRMNFYQYSYAFGSLASGIMHSRYKANPEFAKNVESFLTSGRKASVSDIFREIGIDISSEKVLEEGLSILEADIQKFIDLTSK